MERDKALRFVAAEPKSGAYNVSPMDSDLYSWVLMNGDLFPAQPGSSSSGEEPVLSEATGDQREPNILPEYQQLQYFKKQTGVPVKPEAAPVARPVDPAGPVETESFSKVPTEDLSSLTPEQKRKRRLEKNREIARNCRKRKRERFNQLEEEVVRLRQYARHLEQKVNKGGKSKVKGKMAKDREDVRSGEVLEMEKLLSDPAGVPILQDKLKTYKDLYSDFGRERKSAIQYHMNQLKSLLIPNQVSKMTLWSLQQDDDFYDEKNNQKTFGGGIWNMLCSNLELTAEQKRGLIDMRYGIRKQRRNVAECLRIMNELDTRVTRNFDHMSSQMETIMELITPVQQAKFLMWIAKNQACMHMLNNMWKEEVNPTKEKPIDKPESAMEVQTSIKTEPEVKLESLRKVKPEDMAALLRKPMEEQVRVTPEAMKAALQAKLSTQ